MAHLRAVARSADAGRFGFDELLVMQLRRTPWLLASLGFHLVLVVLLHLFGAATPLRVEPLVERIARLDESPEPVDVPDIAPDVAPDVVPEPTPVLEPKIVDDTPDERPSTDDDAPDDGAKGEPDDRTAKPFTGDMADGSIGLSGGAGGPFGDRIPGRRPRGGPPGGKSPNSAVAVGLEWLRAHQSPDGSWDSDGFMAQSNPAKGPPCDGKGQPQYDVGVTGLALLAFLGAGHSHREGDYRDAVRKGLVWLRQRQDSEGCFGERVHHYTYNHGIAALAMAEAYGMTASPVWKGPAQKGINFVVAAQNPYKGWRYDVRSGESDVSVTGWMVMALKSAQMAGLEVGDDPIKHARQFVVELTDEETGRTGYVKKGERPVRPEGLIARFPAEDSESLTAVGLLTRIFAGENPKDSAAIKAGAELLSKRLPIWEKESGKIDMYYWYYGTLAMFQIGGPDWAVWNEKMLGAIVKTQRGDGNYAGSWDPLDAWGEDGGRVYSTAVMTMCLEVYYRYARVFGTR